ncbi:hypothetical protein MIR68_007319 [Amoeboaphelidium protococcarum]|nr:hypothetical protein MIR68_007319 [Amoeboaphelidium protococcarum]
MGTPSSASSFYARKFKMLNGIQFELQAAGRSAGRSPQDLPMKFYNHSVARTNHQLNRYSDVLPYDGNYVDCGLPNNYINASYINYPFDAAMIDGASLSNRVTTGHYIATQGPKQNTVHDFWRMIYRERVGVILMLTGLTDGDMQKCWRYWPHSLDTVLTFDCEDKTTGNDTGSCTCSGNRSSLKSVSVRLHSEHASAAHNKPSPSLGINSIANDCILRRFILSSPGQPDRSVYQLQYTGWPDHSVPSDTQALIQLHDKVTELCQTSSHLSSPVVVHCSAGCGRTGTFIAISYYLSLIRSSGYDAQHHESIDVDQIDVSNRSDTDQDQFAINNGIIYKEDCHKDVILDIVTSLRRQRPYMVQTVSQLELCYKLQDELKTHRR